MNIHIFIFIFMRVDLPYQIFQKNHYNKNIMVLAQVIEIG